MSTFFQEHYETVIRASLREQFAYENPMQVPKLAKIVVNMGVGEACLDTRKIKPAVEELTLITGQRPVVTLAKKSIAAFKLREGQPVGCKVTLRRHRMYEFLDRLIRIALPRSRDFRGLSVNGFDGRGNFSLGVREQIIFPEIDYDKVEEIRGMDVAIVTTAKTDEEAKALLEGFELPFQN